MPTSENQDTQSGLLHADNYSQYLLHSPREIAYVLRQLAAKHSLVTAVYGSDQEFLLTSVVGVTEENTHVFLDLGPNQGATRQAISRGRLICDTQLERIKIQFEVVQPETSEVDGLPALKVPLPAVLLRLQRREYYRLSVPLSDDMLCAIPLESGRTLNARIIDISGGGVALTVTPANFPFAPGTKFENCSLSLPGSSAPIRFNMEVRNLFRIEQRDGREMVRAGCQFVDMHISIANQIQRYILHAEQERAHRGI